MGLMSQGAYSLHCQVQMSTDDFSCEVGDNTGPGHGIFPESQGSLRSLPLSHSFSAEQFKGLETRTESSRAPSPRPLTSLHYLSQQGQG